MVHVRHSRLRALRRVGLSAVAVIAGCVGAYAAVAIGFHALVEPSLGKSLAVYRPAADSVVAPAAAADPVPSPVEARPHASFALAPVPPAATDNTPAAAPKSEPRSEPKRSAAPSRSYRPARDRWNSWGSTFGASYGNRRWF